MMDFSDLLARPLALGLTLALLAAPLLGCGGGDDDEPDTPRTTSRQPDGGDVRPDPPATEDDEGLRPPAKPSTRGKVATTKAATQQQESLADKIRRRMEAQKAAKEAADKKAQQITEETEDVPLIEGRISSPPKFLMTYGRFEKEDDALGVRARARTNLPPGGRVDAVVYYAGQPIPAFRRRGVIKEGEVEIFLGPAKGYLSSGIYELIITLDPRRQSAQWLKTMEQRFGTAQVRKKQTLTRRITMRQATLMEGELRAAVLHYEDITGTVKTLFVDGLQEVLKGIEAKERFHDREALDEAAFQRWLGGWKRRIARLKVKHRNFTGRYATPPHPELIGRIDVLLDHLEQLGDMRYSDAIVAAGGKRKIDEGAHEEGEFIRPEDLERSIQQILQEIDFVVKGASDEPEKAKQALAALVELGKTGPDYGGETRPKERADKYLAWQAQVQAVPTVYTQHWDAFAGQLLRLQRATIELHGNTLHKWYEERGAELPKGVVLPVAPPRRAPDTIVPKAEALLKKLAKTAPKITTPPANVDTSGGAGGDSGGAQGGDGNE